MSKLAGLLEIPGASSNMHHPQDDGLLDNQNFENTQRRTMIYRRIHDGWSIALICTDRRNEADRFLWRSRRNGHQIDFPLETFNSIDEMAEHFHGKYRDKESNDEI